MLLKFVVDWVDGQISYLEEQETAVVVNYMCAFDMCSNHGVEK